MGNNALSTLRVCTERFTTDPKNTQKHDTRERCWWLLATAKENQFCEFISFIPVTRHLAQRS
jgi:hypothetical protein